MKRSRNKLARRNKVKVDVFTNKTGLDYFMNVLSIGRNSLTLQLANTVLSILEKNDYGYVLNLQRVKRVAILHIFPKAHESYPSLLDETDSPENVPEHLQGEPVRLTEEETHEYVSKLKAYVA